ncbi:T9SS-dependent M36 family metallopeptidase [uncultured Pontibacter sp.]|uniref:T9SS-dependent M36 family metallopeptidase n=1 Tax=uncultured Pontibacter sp. TaxID=453356 RepID=UPI002618F706|nr:T9SS-dependent M36 family metallopeptidase [uncultured Pontibacter sp.]
MGKNLRAYTRLAIVVAMLFGSTVSYGQGAGKAEKKQIPQVALDHIKKNKQKMQVTDQDIAELELSSETRSKKSGVRHLYIKQLHQGIEVHGSVTNISITKEDKVITMGNRFHKEVGKKVKSNKANLDAAGAVAAAASYLNVTLKEPLKVQEKSSEPNKAVTFSKGGISLEPITAKLVYQPMEDGSLKLAWEVAIYMLDAQNYWLLRLDANSGEVLDKDNLVTHCNFENDGAGGSVLHENHSHEPAAPFAPETVVAATLLTANYYNVYPMPAESPSHGGRVQVSNAAADAVASPSGWHKVGANAYTTTRGNNVFAYEDPNNTGYVGAAQEVYGYSPEGGSELVFDFPVDFTKEPVTYRDAAIANLFYWNNLTHDVWYQYGFDEESGNFQADNFGRGGTAGDHVMAEAQDSRNIVATRNNANFSTTPEGQRPRMQMYLWSGLPDQDMFRISSPASMAGSYAAVQASFSIQLTSTPLTGKLVLVNDGSAAPAEGCGALANANEVAGNIAVIYRGSCGFAVKVENAQAAGAIAVIVINNVPGPPSTMGGVPAVPITIPAVMVSNETGANIRTQLDNNQEVSVVLKDDGSGPEIDGDFDNGIIVHEYGHGISNRLTGGRLVVNCLGNAEQMGEGWSDWFGLMMTMKPGDTGEKRRGIGTYANHQPTTGQGIRPAPYSTDFSVNGYTYAATNNTAISQPHGIGFVWSTMLWDMTWAMIDQYGYDEDIYNGTGGNNIAMQLVIDGLKLQSCRPGFIDGRDAILLADQLNYGGANQELLWKVFAKRGLGFSASQGTNTSRLDQVEAFDVPPLYACSKPEIKVTPTSNVYTGAAPTTIFLGYGPQSVMLEASGSVNYSWSPAAGLSDANITNPVFTPTAAGTYTLTVTGTDNVGCTKSNTVTIEVIDVRCGNSKKDKVLVCKDGVAVCVSPNAVPALITSAKGKLGDCGLVATSSSAAVTLDNLGKDGKLALRAVPNPVDAKTDIDFTLTDDANYRLDIVDMRGKSVAVLAEGAGKAGEHHSYQFERGKLAAGVYIARLTTDKEVTFTRIVVNR